MCFLKGLFRISFALLVAKRSENLQKNVIIFKINGQVVDFQKEKSYRFLVYSFLFNPMMEVLLLFVGHDFKHQAVCFVHALFTNGGHVLDGDVHRIVNDTFD